MHKSATATFLTAALAVAATTVGGLADSDDARAAAPVTLTERPGTPLIATFPGNDYRFETTSTFSSAAVADVTGDGRPDVIAGGMNSPIRVFDMATGKVIRLDPGITQDITGSGVVQASPAIADINGDGVDDVVVANMGAHIAAFSVVGGVATTIFNRYVPPAFDGANASLFGTPAVGYIDVDRSLDVVTSGWGMTVDAFSGPSGTPIPGWRYWVKDSIWSSPVIGDISGDGTNSVVVGGDCEGLSTLQPCYGIGKGGHVWAFNLDGSVKWSYFVRDAVVWSTPALIDLNDDGALDVVVGTGLFFNGPAAHKIMALDGKTGTLLWTGSTPGRVMGSPAVARVDGQAQVWVVSEGGQLMSWNKNGGLLWQQCITDSGSCGSGVGTFGGVAVADVNADGRLDAVVQAEQLIRVFDASTGALQAAKRSSYPRTLLPSSATPTIAQVDGTTWIVQVNIGDTNSNVSADGRDDLVITIWTTGTGLGAAPWPTFKGNMARTGGPLPGRPPSTLAPSGRLCFPVAGAPGDAALVNLTPVQAQGPGYGLLIGSHIADPPVASNVNYAPGTVDPNVAITPIGPDGTVCYTNGPHNWVHLVADHLGTINANAYTPAKPDGTPARTIDTRTGHGGGVIGPSGRLCFPVAGAPGDAALVNLTPVQAQGPGYGLLIGSHIADPPVASNVNYAPGTVDPNVAITPIGPDGTVCYTNGPHNWVHLVADHLGTINANAYTPAKPDGTPARTIDTRTGHGGGVIGPSGRLCFPVAGAPGDAALVNLTPVQAQGPGYGLLIGSHIADPPVASNVNYAPGTVDPNVAITPIGPDGTVCYTNGPHNWVHLVADHLGTINANAYTPAKPDGTPARTIDTRTGHGV